MRLSNTELRAMQSVLRWAPRALSFGLLCLPPAPLPGYAQVANQIVKPQTSLLLGGPAVEITVTPASTRNLLLSVPQGQTVGLTFEELQQTSVITWTDSQDKLHTPRTNRSGQGAHVRFTLTQSSGGQERFAVTVASGKRAAHLLVSASAPHPEMTSDKTRQATEESLAVADLLWSKHDPKNAAEALAAYDRAIRGARQLGDRPMLRRSLEWKAIYLAFTAGNPQAAVPLLVEATGITDTGDIVQQASAWKTFGFVQTTLADYPDGWRDYATAFTLFQKTGDRFNQEVLLENRGKLSRMTGDYDGALNDVADAAEIARELDDRTGVLHIEDDIGEIHLLRGEMQPAFNAYQKVLELDSINPADPMIGFAESDLADLYHQINADARSRDMLARAKAFWRAHPYLIGQLATLIQEGKLETDSGDLVRADLTYRHGLNLARSAGMKREIVFLLLGLGSVARERRNNAEAAAHFKQASELADSLHEYDALAEIHTAQGDLALSAGKPEIAADYYGQALSVARQSFDHAGTIAALGGLAHAESQLGQDTEASQHIGQALGEIEDTRNFIPVGSLRTAYFSSRHSYYALAIQVQMDLAAEHPGSGHSREALNIAERARARSLLDQVQQSGARNHENTDPALASARESTLRELHLAESSLATLRGGKPTTQQASELKSHIAELLEQEDRIEAQIARERPTSAGIGIQPSPPPPSQDSIPEMQKRLDPATVLLEYWTGDHSSCLWVVSSTSIHSHQLPARTTLIALASRLTAESQEPLVQTSGSVELFAASLVASRARFDAAALRLGTVLLPARAIPPATHTLLVVGDGPLLSIPFEALRITHASDEGSLYVQDRYSVAREPSVGVLLELLQQPVRRQQMKIAIIADPVFGTQDPRFAPRAAHSGDHTVAVVPADARDAMQLASLSTNETDNSAQWARVTASIHLHRLAFAGQEAREVASLAGPGSSYLASGFSANRQRVHSLDWENYTIAHFATHALLNPSRPELDSIMLSTTADPSGHPQPGALWFSDICNLHMPVELVVLSACQTANGKSMPGEGLVGISYAFFVAGAHRVAGSLWDVDDAATETLIRDFYTALLDDGLSPVEALRSAQRKMSTRSRWSHPYYWAGFTIEGDWHNVPR